MLRETEKDPACEHQLRTGTALLSHAGWGQEPRNARCHSEVLSPGKSFSNLPLFFFLFLKIKENKQTKVTPEKAHPAEMFPAGDASSERAGEHLTWIYSNVSSSAKTQATG